MTVICSDKTGTLTRNEMTVREVVTGSAHYHVSGAGYEPRGGFHPRSDRGGRGPRRGGRPAGLAGPDAGAADRRVVQHRAGRPLPEGDGGWQVIGDPTEGALVVAARKAEVEAHDRDDRVLHEIPFDSDRKAMSVLVRGPGDSATMYTKGAPEVILDKCDRRVAARPDRAADARTAGGDPATAAEMAARALRVLALADRHHPDADHEAARGRRT